MNCLNKLVASHEFEPLPTVHPTFVKSDAFNVRTVKVLEVLIRNIKKLSIESKMLVEYHESNHKALRILEWEQTHFHANLHLKKYT